MIAWNINKKPSALLMAFYALTIGNLKVIGIRKGTLTAVPTLHPVFIFGSLRKYACWLHFLIIPLCPLLNSANTSPSL